MKLAIEIVLPEVKEAIENWEFWGQIELLPDERLKERRMIRHVVENFGRRYSITPQFQFKAVHGRHLATGFLKTG
jgi:hypothetical protein